MDFYVVPQLAALTTATQQVQAQGRYIRYLLETGGVSANTIEVKTNTGKRLLLQPGDDAVIAGDEATLWTVRNYDGSSVLNIVLEIASAEEKITSNRVRGTLDLTDSAARQVGLVYQGTSPWVGQEYGDDFATSFSSTATLNNSGENIVAAASNTGGIKIVRARLHSRTGSAAASGKISLIAKATAPGSVLDGTPILTALATAMDPTTPNNVTIAELLRPLRISSGLRLDRWAVNSEADSINHVLYRLL